MPDANERESRSITLQGPHSLRPRAQRPHRAAEPTPLRCRGCAAGVPRRAGREQCRRAARGAVPCRTAPRGRQGAAPPERGLRPPRPRAPRAAFRAEGRAGERVASRCACCSGAKARAGFCGSGPNPPPENA